MAINSTASFNNRVNYSITDSYDNVSSTNTDSQTITSSYTQGTGNFQINTGATITGVLSASESKQIDLYNDGTGVLTIDVGVTVGKPMDKIKHMSVYNTSAVEGYNIELACTGANSVNGVLGSVSEGTGVSVIRPYSSFPYNDPYDGATIDGSNKYIYINDVAGSGASFKILIMGVDTAQPTGAPTSPY
jgi:hypothetical protein